MQASGGLKSCTIKKQLAFQELRDSFPLSLLAPHPPIVNLKFCSCVRGSVQNLVAVGRIWLLKLEIARASTHVCVCVFCLFATWGQGKAFQQPIGWVLWILYTMERPCAHDVRVPSKGRVFAVRVY